MGARKEKLKIEDLCSFDFDQMEQEWWKDYSEDLPDKDTSNYPVCPSCLGYGCCLCQT